MNKETTAQKIKILEKEVKYWREAHIKLQDQMIKGREIMYRRLDEVNKIINNELKDKLGIIDGKLNDLRISFKQLQKLLERND